MHDLLIDRLNADQPHWFIDWADGQEMRHFALDIAAGHARSIAEARLQKAVAQRLFGRIINAAICCGIVTEGANQ